MTIHAFRDILNSMNDVEYASLQRAFGSTLTKAQFVRDFGQHPEWDTNLCDLRHVPTEKFRETAMRKSAVEAAVQSANYARQLNSQSRLAVGLSIAATVLSTIAIAVAFFHPLHH